MTKTPLILAAALLAGTAFPALAQNTPAPTQNNAQAGVSDIGNNAAPNTQAGTDANMRTAMNTSTAAGTGISSDPSPTQRKGTHLSASQRAKADADEAETTRQLNQQAAALARPGSTTLQ